MKNYERISEFRLSQLSQKEIQEWLNEEITSIALDFGQKLDLDQLRHIAIRLYETLITPKFRNWEPGKIHAVFQNGVTGQYGKASRVTFQLLISWIYSAERSMRGENVSDERYKEFAQQSAEHYKNVADKCIPFIRYCHDMNLDVSVLSQPDYFSMRDSFNNYGPNSIAEDLAALPRYRNFGLFDLVKV